MLAGGVAELSQHRGRIRERTRGEASLVVELLVARTFRRERLEHDQRLLDDPLAVGHERVDADHRMDEIVRERHEHRFRRVTQAELEAKTLEHAVLEDAERGGEGQRAPREQRERDAAEEPVAVEARPRDVRQLCGLGRFQARTRRELERQGLARACQPHRHVPGDELRPGPRGHVLCVQCVQAELVVPREPVVVRPEPQREREPGESAAAQGALGQQGVALGLQPLERERAEPRRSRPPGTGAPGRRRQRPRTSSGCCRRCR